METRETKSLQIGEVFERDLIDTDGRIVLRAGRVLTEEAYSKLRADGCFRVFYAQDETDESPLLRPYDEACMQSVRNLLSRAPARVEDCWATIRSGGVFDPPKLDWTLTRTLEIVEQDAATVMAGVMQTAIGGSDSAPAARSVSMATLAMLVADLMNFSSAECYAVGRAGLLHDISLENGPLWLSNVPPNSSEFDRLALEYFSHPHKSVEILRQRASDLTELEFVLISQVHEQCDGSGFPRRLLRHHLHPLSRILNVVDAFLTLTDPGNPQGALVPADALAYQVYHALQGSFDLACTQALIKAAAAYPIGTTVRLSDNSIGTVMRSTGNAYCDPVVQLVDAPNKILDLRNASVRIESPHTIGNSGRLPKSKLKENLWLQTSY